MFFEYAPFVTKYFYHVLVGVISFILFSKIFGRPDKRLLASASDESTDPSESNVTAQETLYVTVERNIVVFVSF